MTLHNKRIISPRFKLWLRKPTRSPHVIICTFIFFILGLELATPVLEQTSPFAQKKPSPHLLNMSLSWLLAGALPPVYSRPQRAHSPNNSGVGASNK